jgi:phage host-nuclease inhibitor protein Gam
MSTKRVKKPVLQPLSADAAENIMAEYAMLDAQIAEINSKMDQRITTIREEYAEDLQKLGEQRGDKLSALQLWAESNPDAFTKKKSIDMAHGTLGFRTGTPKLKTIKGFTWAVVLELLKQKLPSYVRTVEEPAKDKLLSDREVPEVAALLSKSGVGCEVVQEESFYVELKKEESVAA